jgi:hypothetical protein
VTSVLKSIFAIGNALVNLFMSRVRTGNYGLRALHYDFDRRFYIGREGKGEDDWTRDCPKKDVLDFLCALPEI